MQRKREISVFGECLQTQTAHLIDCTFPDRADSARHDRNAIPSRVSAAIEIKTAGIFERLETRDERPQISNFRVSRYRADFWISERFNQLPERIALKMGISINKDNDSVTNCQ